MTDIARRQSTSRSPVYREVYHTRDTHPGGVVAEITGGYGADPRYIRCAAVGAPRRVCPSCTYHSSCTPLGCYISMLSSFSEGTLRDPRLSQRHPLRGIDDIPNCENTSERLSEGYSPRGYI
jgi:hypothetical protein